MHSTTSESPAPEPPSGSGPPGPPSGAGPSSGARQPASDDAHPPLPATAEQALKIAVVGGFGAGKTTLVRSVSEIRPLSTEETMTRAGDGIDDTDGVEAKHSTTVAFDFGRITLDATSVLYVFGAPGQERFWFLWDRLFSGSLGAVVLVDTRRLEDSWYAIDRLEAQGTPFVVAHNDFGDTDHTLEQVRAALDLDPGVPLVRCDARVRASAKQVLIALVRHVRSLVCEGSR
ncbi:signal recognition particle receptor subunit beta [Nocardiopsis arvandica]|uniref:Signal recognition particle receptor subunit beta n=1 Tax=Nocardiopsis sinuspersici TaxID=501010 RepID=A0A7Z0BGF2_9ACTN|nr:ATP/GTP-binding protein [Nocardiopsis sinuspersici]NYH50478.1 signal recognition particle receptor subunit beta [Nocardiopsis sinuspersici]